MKISVRILSCLLFCITLFACGGGGGGGDDSSGGPSMAVFCVRFNNGTTSNLSDDYFIIEAYIKSSVQNISSASLSGDLITNNVNFFLAKPGELWANSSVISNNGVEPPFPLGYIIQITLDNAAVTNYPFTVTTWEWAQ